MSIELKPCPCCGEKPDRFFVSSPRIEVIACRNGCKPHWMKPVVHIRSLEMKWHCEGFNDLGEVWNTIEIVKDENGFDGIRFSRFATGYMSKDPEEEWGPHLKWSPAISRQRIAERAEMNKQ